MQSFAELKFIAQVVCQPLYSLLNPSTTPASGMHRSSIHSIREGNAARGLLVPHTASNEKGDRLSRSSRTPLAPPSAVIPVEEPKRKKRKYHPELVHSGPELPSHLNNPAAVPSQSRPKFQQGHEFTPAPETEWDDGTYVGTNNHPLFTLSAVPADSEDTPKRNVSLSFSWLIHTRGTEINLRPRLQRIICTPGFP